MPSQPGWQAVHLPKTSVWTAATPIGTRRIRRDHHSVAAAPSRPTPRTNSLPEVSVAPTAAARNGERQVGRFGGPVWPECPSCSGFLLSQEMPAAHRSSALRPRPPSLPLQRAPPRLKHIARPSQLQPQPGSAGLQGGTCAARGGSGAGCAAAAGSTGEEAHRHRRPSLLPKVVAGHCSARRGWARRAAARVEWHG